MNRSCQVSCRALGGMQHPHAGKHSDRKLQGGVRPGSSLPDDPWTPADDNTEHQMFTSPLKRLRQASLLGALPDTITVPPFGSQRGKTVPIELATVDDVTFCLTRLQHEQVALRNLSYALEELLKLARRQGACGADTAISAAVRDLEGGK